MARGGDSWWISVPRQQWAVAIARELPRFKREAPSYVDYVGMRLRDRWEPRQPKRKDPREL